MRPAWVHSCGCKSRRKLVTANDKQRIRWMTRRSSGRSLEQVGQRCRAYLPGWKAYFQLAQTPKV
ncbi:MAG: group II intron reverse transcriptase/maturase, partial [Burkholderiales bacterium]|nr:group II intron reverse transcriptase/maturase [Burkholderiales bacterium]